MRQSNSYSAKQNRIVLVVENEPAIREFLRMVLESMGLIVLEANNGEAALAITRSFTGPIDLVISDVRMPKMAGTEMVYHLRGKRPGIKVLLISGHSIESVPRDLTKGFFQKPFSPAKLRQKVKTMLARDPTMSVVEEL
jgi:DNA-binding NtrC family response regulator